MRRALPETTRLLLRFLVAGQVELGVAQVAAGIFALGSVGQDLSQPLNENKPKASCRLKP